MVSNNLQSNSLPATNFLDNLDNYAASDQQSQSNDTDTTVIEVKAENRDPDGDSISNFSNLQIHEIRQSNLPIRENFIPNSPELQEGARLTFDPKA